MLNSSALHDVEERDSGLTQFQRIAPALELLQATLAASLNSLVAVHTHSLKVPICDSNSCNWGSVDLNEQ